MPDIFHMTIGGIALFALLGHLSYALSACAFLLRDILLLRLLAIAASIANILFAYNGLAGPNYVTIFWQTLFIVINVSWSARLIRERSGLSFSEEEKELYQTVFRAFSPVEFMKLLRLARWDKAAPGAMLAATGAPLDDVMLIYNGEAEVTLPGGMLRRLKDGSFVGEISFIRGGLATADVKCLQPTRYLRWRKSDLRDLLRRNPSMRATLQTVLSEDLTKKLLGQV
jgi:hypothetical protein